MVCGKDAQAYSEGQRVTVGSFEFKHVKVFKYLGLHFDIAASTTCMINNILKKARKSFAWLVNFI